MVVEAGRSKAFAVSGTEMAPKLGVHGYLVDLSDLWKVRGPFCDALSL